MELKDKIRAVREAVAAYILRHAGRLNADKVVNLEDIKKARHCTGQ